MQSISIHALAKRATHGSRIACNPDGISIHALAKRATFVLNIAEPVCCYFNPRPRKEGDDVKSGSIDFGYIFQSTPSQRGRRGDMSGFIRIAIISIHALAKRATERRGRKGG